MRVLELLSALDDETLERLAHQHLGVQDEPRPVRCLNLESELRSAKHIRDTIYNLQPPAFWILEALLDAEGHSLALSGLRERAMEGTLSTAARVTEGIIAARFELMQLYRRVFAEARRSDMLLDASETALLAVLRRELSMHQVEHFLLEHHRDLQQFWNEEHAFLRTMERMRIGGLAFAVEGRLVLPDDFVAIVRQVLGLEMSTDARRRLLGRVAGQDAGEVLQAMGLKASGSKEEKLHRIFDNYIPPSTTLATLGIGQLRDLCRDLTIAVSGSKDELIERVVSHFAADRDIVPPTAELVPPPPEPRLLSATRFDALFLSLRQQDLSDILAGIGSSRLTGAKEQLFGLIKESRFSETSLLMELGLKQLEHALSRHHVKTGGTKREKVQRLLERAATEPDPHGASGPHERPPPG